MSTSENIQVIADWLRGYADTGVELGAPAVESFANMIDLAVEEVAELERQVGVTDAESQVVLDGVEGGNVFLLRPNPRPAFGDDGGDVA